MKIMEIEFDENIIVISFNDSSELKDFLKLLFENTKITK